MSVDLYEVSRLMGSDLCEDLEAAGQADSGRTTCRRCQWALTDRHVIHELRSLLPVEAFWLQSQAKHRDPSLLTSDYTARLCFCVAITP